MLGECVYTPRGTRPRRNLPTLSALREKILHARCHTHTICQLLQQYLHISHFVSITCRIQSYSPLASRCVEALTKQQTLQTLKTSNKPTSPSLPVRTARLQTFPGDCFFAWVCRHVDLVTNPPNLPNPPNQAPRARVYPPLAPPR